MRPQSTSLKRSIRLFTDFITDEKERTHKLPGLVMKGGSSLKILEILKG